MTLAIAATAATTPAIAAIAAIAPAIAAITCDSWRREEGGVKAPCDRSRGTNWMMYYITLFYITLYSIIFHCIVLHHDYI
jgi:hypothetical protein